MRARSQRRFRRPVERTFKERSRPSPQYGDDKSAFQAAEDLYAAKNYDAAVIAYKRFLKTYPRSKLASKAQLQIADLLLIQGRWSAAFDAYQKLITSYPNTPEFEGAVARQVLIANSYLDLSRIMVLGYSVPVPASHHRRRTCSEDV